MRKTFVYNNIRHIVTSSTHISMLSSAREGKYDSMRILLSSVKEEIREHSVVEQEENGAKLAAIGTDKKAIDREMLRLMGLIK